jgi:hypothetical protein
MKEGENIVEEYDKQSLYPMFLKRYHYLHPMKKIKARCAHQTSNANSKLDIFEQTPCTNE